MDRPPSCRYGGCGEELLTASHGGSLRTGCFVKDLQARLYEDIGTRAGKWRSHDVSIKVSYQQIPWEEPERLSWMRPREQSAFGRASERRFQAPQA